MMWSVMTLLGTESLCSTNMVTHAGGFLFELLFFLKYLNFKVLW